MGATIFDCTALAERIKGAAQREVNALRRHKVAVCLHAVLVGDPHAGRIYARSQETRCREVGIAYHLHRLGAGASEDAIRELIHQLNEDPTATGIMLHLPLPEDVDAPAMQYCIDPYKDVEGVNPSNIGLLFYDDPIIAPCTALAVLAILEESGCNVRGKHVCVVGQGPVAGRPLTLALLAQNATVTGCCADTPDIAAHTRHADIIVAAVGVPHLIQAHHIHPGAVVIDVGINRISDEKGDAAETRIVGDVDFAAAREVASLITRVPGGVGPVTVAVLLRSAAEAARKQHFGRRVVR